MPRGFTLVEALVALLVTTVALAGIAALLIKAIREQREVAHRDAALRLVTSLAEQLRALPRPDHEPLQVLSGTGAVDACLDAAPACAAELAAAAARDEWLDAVTRTLPMGSGASVEVVDRSPAAYVISVDWPSAGGARSQLLLRVET